MQLSALFFYLDEIGCVSAMPNLKTTFSFVITLYFHYLCRKMWRLGNERYQAAI